MPEMAARPLHLCLPLQKIPREARLLQEAHVYKQFAENPFVFVDFGGGEIPFDTDGFDEIWKRTNEPAL